MKHAVQTVVLAGTLAVLSACAALPPAKPGVERYWPLPPDPPVISYLVGFSEPKDMGGRPNWLMRILGFILGEEENPHMLRPYAVATDRSGRVYVTDTGLQAVHIFDFSAKRYRQIFWIERGRSRLMSPVGVALDEQGRIYVSDSQLNRIFVYEPKRLRLVQTIGDPGRFERLTGIAYHAETRRLYAVDTAAHRITVLDPDGKILTTFGGRGEKEGDLNFPTHVAVDPAGLLYVTDSMNFRVQIFDLEGKYQGKLGQLGNILGSFSKPKGVAVDSEGHIYVVDGIYDTVQIFDRQGELLMNFGQSGEMEGDFYLPSGITIDSKNRIYVADTYNQRVQVFQFMGSPKEEAPASPP